MASIGRPRAFSSDPPIGSGRDRGSLQIDNNKRSRDTISRSDSM